MRCGWAWVSMEASDDGWHWGMVGVKGRGQPWVSIWPRGDGCNGAWLESGTEFEPGPQGDETLDHWRVVKVNLAWIWNGSALEHSLNKIGYNSRGDPGTVTVITRDSLCRKGRPQKSWLPVFCRWSPKMSEYGGFSGPSSCPGLPFSSRSVGNSRCPSCHPVAESSFPKDSGENSSSFSFSFQIFSFTFLWLVSPAVSGHPGWHGICLPVYGVFPKWSLWWAEGKVFLPELKVCQGREAPGTGGCQQERAEKRQLEWTCAEMTGLQEASDDLCGMALSGRATGSPRVRFSRAADGGEAERALRGGGQGPTWGGGRRKSKWPWWKAVQEKETLWCWRGAKGQIGMNGRMESLKLEKW